MIKDKKDIVDIYSNKDEGTKSLLVFFLVVFILLTQLQLEAQESSEVNGLLFMESVWITTDRSIFIPGETINFCAIVLESDTFLPSSLSKVLKVELIDSEGNPVVQNEFQINNSRSVNILSLPSSLSSGYYYLRAYTNWMRNSKDAIDNFLPLKIVKPDEISQEARWAKPESVNIRLIPENKVLVSGMQNNCSVFAQSPNGDKLEVEGALLRSENDTLATFNTNITGWGRVSFIPETGIIYQAVIKDYPDSKIQLNIPKIQADNPFFSFKIEENFIKVASSRVKSDSIRILIHRNYTWYSYSVIPTKDGESSFTIPINNLPGGIFQLTLFDEDNMVVFKRLFINGEANGEKPNIEVEAIADKYISIKSTYGVPPHSVDSLEIINEIVTRYEPGDLFDYYIPGLPGWQFSNNIPVATEARSGWLIANNYPDHLPLAFFRNNSSVPAIIEYSNATLVNNREHSASYLPETRGYTLSGKVVDDKGLAVPNQVIGACLLSNNRLYTGMSFSSGNFHLAMPEVLGSQNFLVGFCSSPQADWELHLNPRFDTTAIKIPGNSFKISLEEARYIRGLDITRQLKAIYNEEISGIKDTTIKQGTKQTFYGLPAHRIVISKYIKLSNIREVLYEVVPMIAVRKNKNNYRLSLRSSSSGYPQTKDLFLLDGIPIYDFNKLLELPPDRLNNIEILDKLYIHGNATFSGIVSFNTVNKDLAGLELPEKSQIVSQNMPFQDILIATDKRSRGKNLPDLDRILHWKVFITSLTKSYSFELNDNRKDIVTKIFGFNSRGQWIYTKKVINFENDPYKPIE